MSGVDQIWLKRWCNTWRSALRLAQKEREVVYYTTGCKPRELQYVPTPKRQSAAALPRNLKRLMAEREMDVPTLAATAQVSASTIRHYLRGGGYERGTPEAWPNPGLTTLLVIAQALAVGIEVLVEERNG